MTGYSISMFKLGVAIPVSQSEEIFARLDICDLITIIWHFNGTVIGLEMKSPVAAQLGTASLILNSREHAD